MGQQNFDGSLEGRSAPVLGAPGGSCRWLGAIGVDQGAQREVVAGEGA
jgi:hypothetical protein